MNIHGTEIQSDIEKTKSIYAEIEKMAPADYSCQCNHCQTFHKHLDGLFPQEFLDILNQLGINYKYPSEVAYLDEKDGMAVYNGWYHFVGYVENPTVPTLSGDGVTLDQDFIELSETLSIDFTNEEFPHHDIFGQDNLGVIEFIVTINLN